MGNLQRNNQVFRLIKINV